MSDLRPNSEVADGIHWLKDKYVNNYIVETGKELLLIDTAFTKSAKQIFQYIKKELESRPVTTILLTHHHKDHRGGLWSLHNHYHPEIYVSKYDGEFVAGRKKAKLNLPFILKPLNIIFSPLLNAKPVTEFSILNDLDKFKEFQVYHFPGHTLGSLGFLKSKTLFSGDAAIVKKENQVGFAPKIFTEDLLKAKESLKKIAKLDFEILLSGHGTPILEDADQRVRDAVEKLGI